MNITQQQAHDDQQPHKLAVGYVRVSTEGQQQNGISLDAQRKAIEEFAEKAGFSLIEIYEDAASGVGERNLHRRVGLQRALEHVVACDGHLLVWSWDRLSRYSAFEKQVAKSLRIISVADEERISSAARAAHLKRAEALAEGISKATKKGMAQKKAEGAVFGNSEIRKVQLLGTAANARAAEALQQQIMEVLRELGNLSSATRRTMARLLNEKGIRTLHGKPWTESRVTIPLRKAKARLKGEGPGDYSDHPNFGIF
ncbi:recombinase family protein [Pseudooceanicola nanhaiensis]|uniref:recombinase family protein n=1 Tax=Pseudooceanicola nanhaiensis TaxID=375761 RepID=UPI001CD4C7E5|nr:recombinase family protein [Pseudooceanicola nanhaiensis]MCA0921427.1 recombinase family protein [Pseudooceanicola nanhaiensis]